MTSKLNLKKELVDSCMNSARQIAKDVVSYIDVRTTVSVERTMARLLGIDGVDDFGTPLPNIVVDHIVARGGLAKGLAYWMGNAMVQTAKDPQTLAEMVKGEQLDFMDLPRAEAGKVREVMFDLCQQALRKMTEVKKSRALKRERLGEHPPPYAYVLTATGNVYEDVIHACAAANYGADIIAVIRSTAQSLLDYVPYGPTTEGYGGTFATQENFRILRQALDKWGEEHGRYVRLSSFCSGLCMPEIAAMGALEGLDNMVNDALYGILYRDINMVRTLVDQKMSRMINGFSGIVINTGEDNYLRTADALQAAPSVVASQMINYHLALDAGLPESQIGIGNSCEIDPSMTNGWLFELAQAQLTRELFPHCPTKYMPPTKHMNGNIFRTHACDTLFNLITITTQQHIQTIGVPTEGIHTPYIHDRTLGMENVQYVFNNARNFGDEIMFKPGGIIQTRAHEVLKSADELLGRIKDMGLFQAIEKGFFGDVSRGIDAGKGRDGVVLKDVDYFNPFSALILEGSHEY